MNNLIKISFFILIAVSTLSLFSLPIKSSNATIADESGDDVITNELLTLTYKKTGGFGFTSLVAIYDSLSSQITIIRDGNISLVSVDSDTKQSLIDALESNDFFSSQQIYPAQVGADFFEYLVVATIDGKSNAVYWTDISSNVPDKLFNLADEIENILDNS